MSQNKTFSMGFIINYLYNLWLDLRIYALIWSKIKKNEQF